MSFERRSSARGDQSEPANTNTFVIHIGEQSLRQIECRSRTSLGSGQTLTRAQIRSSFGTTATRTLDRILWPRRGKQPWAQRQCCQPA